MKAYTNIGSLYYNIISNNHFLSHVYLNILVLNVKFFFYCKCVLFTSICCFVSKKKHSKSTIIKKNHCDLVRPNKFKSD